MIAYVHTSKSNFSSKHDKRFSKFFFLLSQLPPLCLHTPPWHHKTYTLAPDVYRASVR